MKLTLQLIVVFLIAPTKFRLLSYEIGGLIFGGASTWRGLFLEFYGIISEIRVSQPLANRSVAHK